MDVHKPKPVRSWRELFTELFIIVLGVGIALGAEQTVEWLHWRHRVADARAAMVLELRDDDAPQAFTRVAAADCFERQLIQLRDAIEAGKPRAEVMTLMDNFKLPLRTWDMMAWDALLNSDVAAHIPPEQVILLGAPYIHVPRLSSFAAQEREDWLTLRLVRHSGAPFSAAEIETMLTMVARLRVDNRQMRATSNALLSAMKRNGLAVTAEQRRRILSGLKAHFQGCVTTPAIGLPNNEDQTGFLDRPVQPLR